jgi:predicted SAM-dependent methyltransferase
MKEKLKKIINPIYIFFKTNLKKRLFKKKVSKCQREKLPLKIVIGSCDIYDSGWIPSEVYILDLLNEKTWKNYFQENEIECLLAEHVWEHLTIEQGGIAARTCFNFLKNGGYIRVAVPDGFHKEQRYIDYVKPGGIGAGSDDHKVLYNYKTFSSVFEKAGFKIKLLEYFDENGEFHHNDWDNNKGKIHRSIRFDERNIDGEPNYTSLIIDAYKE